MTKTTFTGRSYTINGLTIPVVDVEPTTDVRFFSQRQLRKLATSEAKAELSRRDGLVSGWSGATSRQRVGGTFGS